MGMEIELRRRNLLGGGGVAVLSSLLSCRLRFELAKSFQDASRADGANRILALGRVSGMEPGMIDYYAFASEQSGTIPLAKDGLVPEQIEIDSTVSVRRSWATTGPQSTVTTGVSRCRLGANDCRITELLFEGAFIAISTDGERVAIYGVPLTADRRYRARGLYLFEKDRQQWRVVESSADPDGRSFPPPEGNFSSDARYLCVSVSGVVTLIDAVTGKGLASFRGSGGRISPNGLAVSYIANSNKLRVANWKDGSLADLPDLGAAVTKAQWSDNSQLIYYRVNRKQWIPAFAPSTAVVVHVSARQYLFAWWLPWAGNAYTWIRVPA